MRCAVCNGWIAHPVFGAGVMHSSRCLVSGAEVWCWVQGFDKVA